MSKKSIISAIIITILVILSAVTFTMSYNITKEVSTPKPQAKAADEKVKVDELVITETKSGKKDWEIYAKTGTYDNAMSKVLLNGIIGNFYKDGKIIMSFASPQGTYEGKTKAVTLTGGASVATDCKVIITSDKIYWAGNNGEIHALGNVIIRKNGDITTHSDKSVFTTDFSKFKIMGNAKSEMYKKGL